MKYQTENSQERTYDDDVVFAIGILLRRIHDGDRTGANEQTYEILDDYLHLATDRNKKMLMNEVDNIFDIINYWKGAGS